ncbi:hypothetical protein P1X14_16650 [Sphingomonas sp. AOB5]|nr:hypothetical protein [Sphingomonas sp. AOB5]MDF7776889.1 hypothetical protein [Sphingomonas sp. AOB5]
MADLPARPAVPAEAVIEGNPAGLSYVGDLAAWAEQLRARLIDAREVCPR